MKLKKNLLIWVLGFGSAFILSGCASGFLKYEKADQMKKIDEFDSRVKIETPETSNDKKTTDDKKTTAGSVTGSGSAGTVAETKATAADAKVETKGKKKKKGKDKKVEVIAPSTKHEPDIEGTVGFVGRRPLKDPFRVGEKVVHSVSYFNMKAGDLTMEVKPFAQVNGKKSYHFEMGLKTSPLFSKFYEVDDLVVSMLDFENMIPSVFTLHVKETGQLKEARFFLDWAKHQANYWEKKVTKKDGPEEKKQQWDVPDYSQNVFSSAFYLRAFNWDVGAENAFRVADNNENLIFRAKGIRREKIKTKVGEFDAIVMKPEVELQGQFKPVGDIFFWLSDDDRKFILRIESKIKIGTIVSEIIELDRGQE